MIMTLCILSTLSFTTAVPRGPLNQPIGNCADVGEYTPINGKYVDSLRGKISNELYGNDRVRRRRGGPSAPVPAMSPAKRWPDRAAPLLLERGNPKPNPSTYDEARPWQYDHRRLDEIERQPILPFNVEGSERDYNSGALLPRILSGSCGLAAYCSGIFQRVKSRTPASLEWLSIFFQNFMTGWLYAKEGQEQERKDKLVMLITAYVVAGTILFTNLYAAHLASQAKFPEKFAINMEISYRNGELPSNAPAPTFTVDKVTIDSSGNSFIPEHLEIPEPISTNWGQHEPQDAQESDHRPSSPQPRKSPTPATDELLPRDGGKHDDYCAASSWMEWQTVIGHIFGEVVIPMMRDGHTSVTLALAHWGRNVVKVSQGGQTLVRWWLSGGFNPGEFYTFDKHVRPYLADLRVQESPKSLLHQECYEGYGKPRSYSTYDPGPPSQFWESFAKQCRNFNLRRRARGSSVSFKWSQDGWEAEYFADDCTLPVDCASIVGDDSDAKPGGQVAVHIRTCTNPAKGADKSYHGGLIRHKVWLTADDFRSCGVIRIRPSDH